MTEDRRFLNALMEAPAGQILHPGELASRFNLSKDEVVPALTQALNEGLIEPVYRLYVGKVWTKNLLSLRSTFFLEDGSSIDGSDPSNIEVAFRKIDHPRGRGV